ncbi:MAG: molybdopterin-dependent oxidoreductase [Deltaproteobacteria bacterium]|nr:molybdopterin-dependent oxidoreductase [Deltaproteobacteria bacterium]MBW1962318.1 molybdopterin-dependent oxidoreductase [Deltaproteobacteria bacterium]MBW1993910.1 molybdopterin-dependent oxidoreductase [Deltaproteobacteria bacterium]MBW2151846.1 molybdopterin-dependent oxidoreductase [Deltaproteobacteria bacterium]
MIFTETPHWNSTLGIENRAIASPIWQKRYPLAADGSQALTNAMIHGEPYLVKALICVSGNPVAALPHTENTLKALRNLDLLVVNDLFMTETAREADFVLPGTTFFEKWGYPDFPQAEDTCACNSEFPYRLVTGYRIDAFNHSQHRNISELLRYCPVPEAEIPPEIAVTLDVTTGDLVLIETRIGTVKMKAKIVEGMNPLTVCILHGLVGRMEY